MPALADVTAVLADRTRAQILDELLGGVPLTAGSLAMRVGVAPSTISGHLRRLEEAKLVTVEQVGRAREVSLAGPRVAHAIEALAALATDEDTAVGLRAVNKRTRMRRARSCYDHLAGELGVAVCDALVEHGALVRNDNALALGDADAFAAFGVDLGAAREGKRPVVRGCRDWTERREHLAGAAGAATMSSMLDNGWVQRSPDARTLIVTADGERALGRLGVTI